MRDQAVDITSVDGIKIPAILHSPQEGDHAETCVLLLHGLTTSKDEYQGVYKKLAIELGRKSVCSLRIDFRGHGESPASLSDYSVHSQVLDTLSALAFLSDRFPRSRIRLLGTSYGAPPAIIASDIKDDIDKVVLLAPILSFERTFLYPSTPWAKEHFGISRYETALSDGIDIGDNFVPGQRLFLDHFVIDPLRHLKRVSSKCVILHGDEDGMVPFTVSREVAESLDLANFHQLKNTGHGLAEVGDESRSSSRTRENEMLLLKELVG